MLLQSNLLGKMVSDDVLNPHILPSTKKLRDQANEFTAKIEAEHMVALRAVVDAGQDLENSD